MKINLFFKIFFIIFFLYIDIVYARYISLSTTVTTNILTDYKDQINISITNFGDEPAYNVKLNVLTNDFITESVYLNTIDVNENINVTVPINISRELKEGIYLAVLLTEYTDLNGYPLSAISPINLIYKNFKPSKIFIKFNDLSIDEKETKQLQIKIKNIDQKSHTVFLKIFLPNEMISDNSYKEVFLNPNEEKSINFEITNLSGLRGSNYTILALAEYEDENSHYSSYISGNLSIVENKSTFNLFDLLPIFTIILIIIFIFYKTKNNFFGKKLRQN